MAAKQVFRIGEESKLVKVKYGSTTAYEALTGTEEYSQEPDIKTEEVEVAEDDGATSTYQTGYGLKLGFKTVGYKGNAFQKFLRDVASGVVRFGDNKMSIQITDADGNTYEHVDGLVNVKSIINGKTNDLAKIEWEFIANGFGTKTTTGA